MIDSVLIGSICWPLIMESRGLLGNVFAHIKGSSLICLQRGKEALQLALLFSRNNRLQAERLGRSREAWNGGRGPTDLSLFGGDSVGWDDSG